MMWTRNNKVFKIHSDIRKDNPKISLPRILTEDILTELGYKPVEAAEPVYDKVTEDIEETTPELIDGSYKQKWIVKPLDEETVTINRAKQRSLNEERARLKKIQQLKETLSEQRNVASMDIAGLKKVIQNLTDLIVEL